MIRRILVLLAFAHVVHVGHSRPGHPHFRDLAKSVSAAAGRYWRMPLGDELDLSPGRTGRSKVLLAVPTANVWAMTHALLASLVTVDDDFDLLFMDDLSADGTDAKLAARHVFYIQPPVFYGLTYLWNMAYAFYRRHSYQYLVIANNDVLVPSGVVDRLVKSIPPSPGASERCDLITPMSTVAGKGHMGKYEGIEAVMGLNASEAVFVNRALNYARVQDMLNRCSDADTVVGNLSAFNGFFFAMNTNIIRAEYSKNILFNPHNVMIHQEQNLTAAMEKAGLRTCLHKGAFVYHFKASTVPPHDWRNDRRNEFRHATKHDVPPASRGHRALGAQPPLARRQPPPGKSLAAAAVRKGTPPPAAKRLPPPARRLPPPAKRQPPPRVAG